MNEQQYKEKGFLFSRGKWLATFKVLLNAAHEKYGGKFSITTKLIEANHENKSASDKNRTLGEPVIDRPIGLCVGRHMGLRCTTRKFWR